MIYIWLFVILLIIFGLGLLLFYLPLIINSINSSYSYPDPNSEAELILSGSILMIISSFFLFILCIEVVIKCEKLVDYHYPTKISDSSPNSSISTEYNQLNYGKKKMRKLKRRN